MDFAEIPLDAPVGTLGGLLVVETEAGRTLVTRSRLGNTCELEAHLPNGRLEKLHGVGLDEPLGQVIGMAAASRPIRAFQASSGTVVSRYRRGRTAAHLAWIAIGLAAGLAGIFVDEWGWVSYLLVGVGMFTLFLAQELARRSMRHRQWALHDDGTAVLAAELPLPALPEEIEIDDVKAEYGRLVSDVVYRIEYPALFDAQEPTTKAFTLALLQWDNNEGVVADDERRELADRVRATFEAARANAERVGMDHLPVGARDRAGTALKAARLATDERTPEAERETALRRAVAILDELALYYLPSGTDARRAITGRQPLALPGRRMG